MKAAVIYKPSSADIKNEIEQILKEKGVIFKTFDVPTKEIEKFDFIISIGGDGTILRILQEIKHCPPLLGINTGRIGLLTQIYPHEFRNALEKIVRGEIEVEEFMRLNCKISKEYESGKETETLRAINEIAILTALPAKLIEVSIFVDDTLIDTLRSDGLLISTPLGSTAYALSAGGPIIDPSLDSFLIIPIAPFKLRWKPWVIGPEKKVKVLLHPDKKALVVADGQKVIKINPGTTVFISKSKHPVRFFKINKRFEKIVRKLEELK